MARRKRRGRRSRRRSGGRGRSLFSFLGMLKSWKFWTAFAVAGTLLFAFWSTPLTWMAQGADKLKSMFNKKTV